MVSLYSDRNTSTKNKKEDYGLFTSVAAGLGSGVFKIFEGAATLGATLLDLGVDKNRAEAVEKYFDDIILLMKQQKQQLLVKLQN